MENTQQLSEIEEQLRQTQELLESNKNLNDDNTALIMQRNILGVLALLFLGGFILYYVLQNKSNISSNENMSLIAKDSLNIYKEGYFSVVQNANKK